MAEEEDDDDGEEHGSHGGVPAVALGDGVVNHGGSEKSRLNHVYFFTFNYYLAIIL